VVEERVAAHNPLASDLGRRKVAAGEQIADSVIGQTEQRRQVGDPEEFRECRGVHAVRAIAA
jgi:hypothetical protein